MGFFSDLKRDYRLRRDGTVWEGEGGGFSFSGLGRAAGFVANVMTSGVIVGVGTALAGPLPFITSTLVYTALSANDIHDRKDLFQTLLDGYFAVGSLAGDAVDLTLTRSGQLADAVRDAWRQRRDRERPEDPSEVQKPRAFLLPKGPRDTFAKNAGLKYAEMSPDGPAPKREYKPLLGIMM